MLAGLLWHAHRSLAVCESVTFGVLGGKRRGGSLKWAERVPLKDHLRRAALCDMALDTFDYNMGATGMFARERERKR